MMGLPAVGLLVDENNSAGEALYLYGIPVCEWQPTGRSFHETFDIIEVSACRLPI